ncbi:MULTISPECIES: hypothetical protein [Gordonia]|uniref:Uncharacterized protein n=1 Tax=Gordonia sihwensis NBRC 108236 TaxID=1223544 RepID=L7LML7_9ACTN|nr:MULTISPECIES: hypothetical protein [Gordonia]AUH70563.1 hypothetical protein CXX93_19290 [Gordonia sp. YC-JH1]WFN95176.1 hypothetical protein P5P27_20640 [Gordonia sihwensis]GAC62385.1 hypothetical protein GSI01S_33_00710 [Gordonia sihwensis NBRC 108236]
MTITRTDIHSYVVEAAVGDEFDAETIDRLTDAVVEAAPLSTWSLQGTEYVSTALDVEAFWSLVETITARPSDAGRTDQDETLQ